MSLCFQLRNKIKKKKKLKGLSSLPFSAARQRTFNSKHVACQHISVPITVSFVHSFFYFSASEAAIYIQCTSSAIDLWQNSNHKPKLKKTKTRPRKTHWNLWHFGCDHTTIYLFSFFSIQTTVEMLSPVYFSLHAHSHWPPTAQAKSLRACQQNSHEPINSSLWWPVITLYWKLG